MNRSLVQAEQDTLLKNPALKHIPNYKYALYAYPNQWSKNAVKFGGAMTLKNQLIFSPYFSYQYGFNPRYTDFKETPLTPWNIEYLAQKRLGATVKMPMGLYSKPFHGASVGIWFETSNGVEVINKESLIIFDPVQETIRLKQNIIGLVIGGARVLPRNVLLDINAYFGYLKSREGNRETQHFFTSEYRTNNGPVFRFDVNLGTGFLSEFKNHRYLKKDSVRVEKFMLSYDMGALLKNGIKFHFSRPIFPNGLLDFSLTYANTTSNKILKTTLSEATWHTGVGVGYDYFFEKTASRLGNYVGISNEFRYAEVGIFNENQNINWYSFFPNITSVSLGHIAPFDHSLFANIFVKSSLTIAGNQSLNIHDYVEHTTGVHTTVGIKLGMFR